MSEPSSARPRWEIDLQLEALIGQPVRLVARTFAPLPRNGEPVCFRPVRDLFLPDNSQPGGLPVYFQGRLVSFERRIGVVQARLDSLPGDDHATEGFNLFRGKSAVILHGPALVELAWPFVVERLPLDAENYWRDLRVERAQLVLPAMRFAEGLPTSTSKVRRRSRARGHKSQ